MARPLPRKILRLMLLGRTGAGKSSAVGTILPHGLSPDTPEDLRRSVRRIGERNFQYDLYNISTVDTPDWLSPVMSDDDVVADMVRCSSLSAPGPHAFLLVVPLSEPSQEDRRWIKLIQEIFGTGALNYIILLFTHADRVSESVDQLVDNGNEVLRDLVTTCGNRYHEFTNKITSSDAQVKTMLRKVLNMVRGNGSTFYQGHNRASPLRTTMEEETRERRREVVETLRRGQGEGCMSGGLFAFCENALAVEVKQEEMERGIGGPGREEVKTEDTDPRNGSEGANHWEGTNVKEEEKETGRAEVREEAERGQVARAEEEMQKRREREEMTEKKEEKKMTTEELGIEGHVRSDGAQEKSRKEEKKKKREMSLAEGAIAQKKEEEREKKKKREMSLAEGAIAQKKEEKRENKKKREMSLAEGEIAQKKEGKREKKKKREMSLAEGAIAQKKEEEREKKKKREMSLAEGEMAQKKEEEREKKKKREMSLAEEEREKRSSLQEAEMMKNKKEKIVTEEVGLKRLKKRKDDSEGRSGQRERGKKKQRTDLIEEEVIEEELPGPSHLFTPGQRERVQKPTQCSPLKTGEKADIWTMDMFKLPVTCGDKEGILNGEKLAKAERCIMADERWFTPACFERYGGRESSRNWKSSIKCHGTTLGKLIKDGHLSTSGYSKRNTQNTEALYKDHSLLSPAAAKISPKGKTKAKRELCTNKSVYRLTLTADEEEHAEQEPDRGYDNNDEMVFEVTCGAVTGKLHKRRFASDSFF